MCWYVCADATAASPSDRAVRISSCWRADSAWLRDTLGPPCSDAHSSRIRDSSSGLRDLNEKMRALTDDDPGYAELNREFHFTVYEYARSPLLLSLMRLLWASLHGGPRVSRTHAESARQHDDILTALSDRDAAGASAQTHQHIMGADPVKEVTQ